MDVKRISLVLLLSVLLLFALFPALAQNSNTDCHQVSGALMTNLGVIPAGGPFGTNLGPVSGDLKGAVAATILGENSDGTFNVQHYWVTAAGDTIKLAVAHLTPTYPVPSNPSIVAVPWGNYSSKVIPGGTGKFANATGTLDYFGLADFNQGTLVLRYRGQVCYNDNGEQK